MTDTDLQEQPETISVPEKHATVLSQFALQPAEVQSAVYSAAGSIPVSVHPWDEARSLLSQKLQSTDIDVKALVHAFRGIFHVRQAACEVPDADFVAATVRGIQSSFVSGADGASLQGVVVNVLALSNLMISHKAGRMRYQHAFHVHDTSIITDVRPVFDITGSAVEGSIISHTLRIDYASANEKENAIYLALDDDDLEQLEIAIKRARRKEVALRSITESSALKLIGDE